MYINTDKLTEAINIFKSKLADGQGNYFRNETIEKILNTLTDVRYNYDNSFDRDYDKEIDKIKRRIAIKEKKIKR